MTSSPSSSVKMKPLMLKDFLRENCNSDSSATGFGRAFPRKEPKTTVRYLLEVELLKDGKIGARKGLLVNRSLRNNLFSNKLSTVLNAVKSFPFKSSSSCSASSSSSSSDPKHRSNILSRNFSHRFLQRSLWKKRLAEDTTSQIRSANSVVRRNKVLIRDIIRLGSFADVAHGGKSIDIPSLSGRSSFSCSSSGWSECGRRSTTLSGSDSVRSPSSPVSSEFIESGSTKPANLTNNGVVNSNHDGLATGDSTATSNGRGESKEGEMGGEIQNTDSNCLRYEEKEQFSPVCVKDFPYDEEEEMDEEEPVELVVTPPPPSSFHQTLAKLEHARRHLLHKIRRFEEIARLVSPVDLHDSFDSERQYETEEEEEEEEEEEREEEPEAAAVEIARELLEKLKSTLEFKFDWNNDLNCNDNLLLGFFVEGWSRHEFKRTSALPEEDRTLKDELICVARNWIEGSGTVADGAAGGGVELQVKEMENDKRWRCFVHVEEADVVAADLEHEVFSSLMDELLLDLVKV